MMCPVLGRQATKVPPEAHRRRTRREEQKGQEKSKKEKAEEAKQAKKIKKDGKDKSKKRKEPSTASSSASEPPAKAGDDLDSPAEEPAAAPWPAATEEPLGFGLKVTASRARRPSQAKAVVDHYATIFAAAAAFHAEAADGGEAKSPSALEKWGLERRQCSSFPRPEVVIAAFLLRSNMPHYLLCCL